MPEIHDAIYDAVRLTILAALTRASSIVRSRRRRFLFREFRFGANDERSAAPGRAAAVADFFFANSGSGER
jgi:hypothetical protein